MKTISAGILVKTSDNRYLLGHATNQYHYDIFKGRQESGETNEETAIRECREESGLIFSKIHLHSFGVLNYTKKKDLALFMAKIDSFSMSDLKCTTFLDNGDPEMDFYRTFSFDEMLSNVAPAMRKVMESHREEIEAY